MDMALLSKCGFDLALDGTKKLGTITTYLNTNYYYDVY